MNAGGASTKLVNSGSEDAIRWRGHDNYLLIDSSQHHTATGSGVHKAPRMITGGNGGRTFNRNYCRPTSSAGRDRLASSHSRILPFTVPADSPGSAAKLETGAPSCCSRHTGELDSPSDCRTASYSSPRHHTVTRLAMAAPCGIPHLSRVAMTADRGR